MGQRNIERLLKGATVDDTTITTLTSTTVNTSALNATGAVALSGAVALTDVVTPSASGMVDQKVAEETTSATYAVADTDLGGVLILSKAGVTAVTLPDPVAANSGKWIEIVSTTVNQHTITAGANNIVAVADVAATTLTASAAIGNAIKLVSDGTLWYEVGIVGAWVPT